SSPDSIDIGWGLYSGGGTNYKAALTEAESLFGELPEDPSRSKNLVFLSDGYPNHYDYGDKVTDLQNAGVHLRAFGAGSGADKEALEDIDPNAQIFLDPKDLIDVFSGLTPGQGGRFTEDGIGDWPIYLYRDEDDDGQVTGDELLNPFASTTTDASGDYSFTDLMGGTYLVREERLSGYMQTGPNSAQGPGESYRIEDNGGGNYDYLVNLSPAQHVPFINFGNVIIEPITDAAPYFTSTPIVDAQVGTTYEYHSTASDPESTVGDPANNWLAFSLPLDKIVWPDGFSPAAGQQFDFTDQDNPIPPIPGGFDERGEVTWNPPAELAGKRVTIVEAVTDSFGNEVSRPIEIYVHANPVNRAPEILNTPPDEFSILQVLEPQVLEPPLDEPTNPELAVIDGQTWLDLDTNGRRGSSPIDIVLATDGKKVKALENLDDTFTKVPFAGKLPDGTLVPFDFEFYSDADGNVQTWNQFYINSNGNITFEAESTAYVTVPLSNPDLTIGDNVPRIAPFWDHIDPSVINGIYRSGQVRLARGMSPRGNPFVQIDWPDVFAKDYEPQGANDFTLYIEDDPAGDIVAFLYRNMEWAGGRQNPKGPEVGFTAANGTDYVRMGVENGQIVAVTDGPNGIASMLAPFNGTDAEPVILVFRIGPLGGFLQQVESGADGFVVDLVDPADGAVLASQISRSVDLDGDGIINRQNEMGRYRFVDVPPGSYEVRVQPRPLWLQTRPAPPPGEPITVVASETVTRDFGFARLYAHTVEAVDYDDDSLTYSLIDSPAGAAIDAQTGKLTWPAKNIVGDYPFTVRVADDGGLFDEQSFTLKVRDNTVNVLPSVTSKPPKGVAAGRIYSYPITAYDANLDPLLFELIDGEVIDGQPVTAPDGLTVDADTGLVRWETTVNDVGTYSVSVRVIDAAGRVAEADETRETFTIEVVPPARNDKPVIESRPPEQAVVGLRYLYQLQAYDPEGERLSYGLVAGPPGMKVSTHFGYLVWDPKPDQAGSHPVAVRVYDPRGGSQTQTFTLEVFAENPPPTIVSKPADAGIDLEYVYPLEAIDPNEDAVTFTLLEAPAGMSIE
ncbi:MAG: putative Ig domain-containing protein, partial [Pirellulales bacterium]